jgi:hypothetical protein
MPHLSQSELYRNWHFEELLKSELKLASLTESRNSRNSWNWNSRNRCLLVMTDSGGDWAGDVTGDCQDCSCLDCCSRLFIF